MKDYTAENISRIEKEEGNESVEEEEYKDYDNEYGGTPPPNIGFLNSQTSSFFRNFPNDFSSLIKPLVPNHHHNNSSNNNVIMSDQDYYRQSSHSLLLLKEIDENDDIKPTSSYGQAVLNGMNILCGVGLLSTVNAVKQGGWLSLIILLAFAVLAYYTGILLRRCVDSKPGAKTYPDIGGAAFGYKGKLLISIVLYVELYVSCVEYIILESDTLSSLFPGAELNIAGYHLGSKVVFAIVTALIVLPTAWLRDLSLLSYVSAGGVVATIIVVACLCWVGIIDDVGFKNEGGVLINWSGIPFAVGLYGYCYAGHAVFPNLYCSLKNRSQYPSVLFTSFLFTTIMFGGTAIVGYLMFGSSSLSEFTLNMPNTLIASKIAVCTTVVNPICKYALTLMPISVSIEELIPKNMRSRSYSITIRTALVLSSLLVALTVPFFDLVMAFAGSALAMFVTLIFPCVCFISIARDKLTCTQMSMCILIIAVGVVSAVVGTYSSLSKIIHELV